MATEVDSPPSGDNNSRSSENADELAAHEEQEVSHADLPTRLEWVESKYRNTHDTDIEWLHRKAFLAAHVGRYANNRLQALAACYANTVVLGCRYPKGVMDELNRVEEDTINAVETLLAGIKNKSGALMHLRSRRLSSSKEGEDGPSSSSAATRGSEETGDSGQQEVKRPEWFNELGNTS